MNYQMKDIQGFPGYRVDTNGQVWSCYKPKGYGGGQKTTDKWKKLSPIKIQGYHYINLYKNHKMHMRRIHRLVLEAFIGVAPLGKQTCHNNGIRNDNKLENLRWGTIKDNALDRVRHGTQIKGSKVPWAKLTEKDIPLIRELLFHSHLTHKRIGEIFKVSISVIEGIARGKNWKHVIIS